MTKVEMVLDEFIASSYVPCGAQVVALVHVYCRWPSAIRASGDILNPLHTGAVCPAYSIRSRAGNNGTERSLWSASFRQRAYWWFF